MTTDPLEHLLAHMRDEPKRAVIERERGLFDRLAGPLKDSLILFGAGPLGRQALAGLRRAGVEPICFADNRESLWGAAVDRLEVLSPSEAAARHAATACFVVTVYNPSRPRRQLLDLGCRTVTSYAPLYWKYSDIFIPSSCMGLAHPMWDCADQLRAAYSLLADDLSRHVFLEQLQWRMDLDSSRLQTPSPVAETYFPPDIVAPSPSEVFVDCGAFDGDSIDSFLKLRSGQFGHIYALEPDPANRGKLENFRLKLPSDSAGRFTVLPYAVGKHRSRIRFAGGDEVRSHVAGEAEDGECECVPLDEIFAEGDPTYIKMDIEGAEPDAIAGAAQLLNRAQPVLAACVYHRWEHLWEIPLLIRSLSPSHGIFLRRYAEDCWELVCYAVPQSRLRS